VADRSQEEPLSADIGAAAGERKQKDVLIVSIAQSAIRPTVGWELTPIDEHQQSGAALTHQERSSCDS
jgi:hypothetical protein